MVDGSKIGAATNAVVAGAERIDALVTDASAPATELDRLRALRIRIVFAGRPGLEAHDDAQAVAGGVG